MKTTPGRTRSEAPPPTPPPGPRRTSRPGPIPNTPSDSRQRILDAATAEFALRGFEAATVDRIARRARLNRAMLYYHFHSKRALYTAVLRTVFTLMRGHLAAIAASANTPADKLDQFVALFVLEGQHLAHIAPIMLREIADGGRRLDEETYAAMVHVLGVIRGIVDEGRRDGVFADVDPHLLWLTTVWPIVVYLAAQPIRNAIARVARFDASLLDQDRFIRHMQTLNRRMLLPTAAAADPSGDLS